MLAESEGPNDVAHAGQVGWRFDNSYARLPGIFYQHVSPAAVPEPRVCIVNDALAREYGLDLSVLDEGQLARLFAGQELPSGAEPIAQAYAGHQFGGFTMLGDGRAILLGEHLTPDGMRVDIQFKGSGRTAFSRGGDGLAAVGPMLREYIISEAMAALGIPTTRSLAVVTTGHSVYRESMLPGAILTRTAASHVRVGTFQYLAARRDDENLKRLADYVIERHYPGSIDAPGKYLELLRHVVDAQASLIAKWQLVGFVHGVMNTDNMAVSGETIDYGPCAFLDVYHSEMVFSSIDHGGRYAFGNQPGIAQWNLARLAETLLPLIDEDEKRSVDLASEVVYEFASRFELHWMRGFREKLGFQSEQEDDAHLFESMLAWMEAFQADFTQTFVDLATAEGRAKPLYQADVIRKWMAAWADRLAKEGSTVDQAGERMREVNPVVIPRNHRVEEVLEAASERGDLGPLHRLLEALREPYRCDEASKEYRDPPPPGQCRYQTFCGT